MGAGDPRLHNALPSALRRLPGARAAPRRRGEPWHGLLRTDTALAIMPLGTIRETDDGRALRHYCHGARLDWARGSRATAPRDPRIRARYIDSRTAHIWYALRQHATGEDMPAWDELGYLGQIHMGDGMRDLWPLERESRLAAAGDTPDGLVSHIICEAREWEDHVCGKALSEMPEYGGELPRGWSLTLANLLALPGALNAGQPPHRQVDTVFTTWPMRALCGDPASRAALARCSRPYSNMACSGGVTVMAHVNAWNIGVYLVSSRHGPTFINGPTVVRTRGDTLCVTRYCDAYVVPAGGPGGALPGFTLTRRDEALRTAGSSGA